MSFSHRHARAGLVFEDGGGKRDREMAPTELLTLHARQAGEQSAKAAAYRNAASSTLSLFISAATRRLFRLATSTLGIVARSSRRLVGFALASQPLFFGASKALRFRLFALSPQPIGVIERFTARRFECASFGGALCRLPFLILLQHTQLKASSWRRRRPPSSAQLTHTRKKTRDSKQTEQTR